MKSKYIFFLALLLAHSSFVDLRPLSANNLNLYVQMLSALFLIVLVLRKWFLFFAKYKLLNVSLGLFATAYSISTYNVWHKHVLIALMSPYTSMLEFIKVICAVFLMQYIRETKNVSTFLKYFLVILGAYLFVANIEALGGKANGMDICLLGDKFVLSYTNLFWISVFCYYRYFKTYHFNLLQYRILLMLSFVVSSVIGCSTGIIVAMSMLILSFVDISFISKIMVSPLNLIIAILVFDLGFYFTYETILKNDFVKYVIVDLLGEDLTLTSRTIIWDRLDAILDLEPLWGFGPGNETSVVQNLVNLTNAQNGILHDYLGVGIIGVASYLILVYAILKTAHLRKPNTIIYFFFGLVVASVVEVSLTTVSLCYLSFLIICNLSIKMKMSSKK